jgi:CheY-like chemotaxis protein
MPDNSAPRIRALIVDPNEAFVTVATSWMANRALVEVTGIAGTGPEALLAVERLDPDLVVVDAVLPELDGFRVVREIKKRNCARFVIVTTFFATTAAREAAIDAGADEFVPKDEFTALLEPLLDRIAQTRSARST